jgi:hypothetical protein
MYAIITVLWVSRIGRLLKATKEVSSKPTAIRARTRLESNRTTGNVIVHVDALIYAIWRKKPLH